MHGHVRAGFSAFCLLLTLPLLLPLLLPAIVEGNVWKITLTAVSLASDSGVWLPLGISAMVLLGTTSLARRYRVRSKARSADNIEGIQRLDPMRVAEWAPAITESP